MHITKHMYMYLYTSTICNNTCNDFIFILNSTEDLPQQNVFTRIDPTKLNTALGNATVLGNLEVSYILFVFCTANPQT